MSGQKQKIFIAGISGLIGYALAQQLKHKYLVAGVFYRNQVEIPGVQCYPLQVSQVDFLDTMVRRQHPDHIICAVGISDKKEIEAQPKIANLLNVAIPGALAITSSRIGARYIYLSCPDIFDGEKGNYAEDDNDFTLVDEVGKHKLAAQAYIRAKTLESITLRLGKATGLGHPGIPSFFDQIRFAAAGKKQIEISKNKSHSFLSLESITRAVEALMCADLAVKHYCYHVGGVNMSEFDFARNWFSLMGADTKLVRGHETDFKRNLTLNSTVMQTQFPSWKAETKEELFLQLLKNLTLEIGVKKWQKILQIP